MVAPAGVNEEIPREPVKVGPAHAEPVAGKLAAVPDEDPAVVPEGELAAAAPGEADPGETELAEADHAEADHAEADHAEAGLAKGGLAEAELTEREPAEGKAAEGEAAEGKAAEGKAPEGKAPEAGPADAELAGTGGPGWDAEKKSRDVSPLAVAGIILGVIALVGVAVGVLAVITHGFKPKTVITYRPAAVFGLRPGECINSTGNGLNVTVLSCATPHDAEVFATFSLPKGTWPGDSAVQQEAGNGCESRLGGYLNPQLATADLTQEYVYPNQAAWQAGERTVVCEVRAVSGQLTGSVRAAS
jgi:hypothetical protein